MALTSTSTLGFIPNRSRRWLRNVIYPRSEILTASPYKCQRAAAVLDGQSSISTIPHVVSASGSGFPESDKLD